MIRFLVKSAALLGLAAVILPNASGEGGPDLSVGGLLFGIQEAASDLSGFCDRAPTACLAGREAASFAAAQIGEGARLAYAYARGEDASLGDGPPVLVEVTPRSTDPTLTGSLPGAATALREEPRTSRLDVERAIREAEPVHAQPPRRAAPTPAVPQAYVPPRAATQPRAAAQPPSQRGQPRPYPMPSKGPAVPDRPLLERSGEGVIAFAPSPAPAPKNNRAFAQIPRGEVPSAPAPNMPVPRPAPRA